MRFILTLVGTLNLSTTFAGQDKPKAAQAFLKDMIDTTIFVLENADWPK